MISTSHYFHPELKAHWLISGFFSALVVAYLFTAHLVKLQIAINLDPAELLFLKNLCYALSIILFPLVKLFRHILLRLNQTMPHDGKSAQQRYFHTIAITQILIHSVGVFGFLLFILGEGYNTLYIFSLLAGLGVFLNKPNFNEYLEICESVNKKI